MALPIYVYKKLYKNFSFQVLLEHNKARVSVISTPHGVLYTPAFIFCATKASVKSLDIRTVRECGTQIVLSNTYHLMLQPGAETVASLGGLHGMLGWSGPMLTDSGGYQIFSLSYGSVSEELKGRRRRTNPSLIEIDEDGATFRSYIDGKVLRLTPEKSMQIQRMLGADFVVVLDECTPFYTSYEYTAKSMHMSNRWALQSLQEFQKTADGSQALYCVTQGGVYSDLRKVSCEFVNNLPFFGNAIGGSLGAHKQQMYDTVSLTTSLLSRNRPVHLLGIGNICDIFHGVISGVDTFDCVYPTRIARHGAALVKPENRTTPGKEYINLRNSEFRHSLDPIEGNCGCYTCKHHSRGYLHHLLKAKELLAHTLLTTHNVYFMNNLMQLIRRAIAGGTLEQEYAHWTNTCRTSDASPAP
ncbi:tRNA guanosine(34) transglycosylase Tgt [Anaplasma capra]|uniref:tRNA guanosine(34) transglycosylase Tgt n=1 Tax=Anaplasma capra TaxID=1562740 RepID=UPI0021D5A1BE|nr:tRNA guanosine(34) transglycosylase Tgt [Anaplasma capra]MCU7611501.1 tRNA guanosine(34) transglycosylase Tgt [Anaplasma capra]MCU7612060.1 tRNA guanosine(34) transglycosylase Tgt [Anaplasma capra]